MSAGEPGGGASSVGEAAGSSRQVARRGARAPGSSWVRRRLSRRRRRFVAFLVLVLPMVWMLYEEILRRGATLVWLEPRYLAAYAGGLLQSAVLWGLLLFAASRRRGLVAGFYAGLFFMGYVLVHGTSAAFFAVWNTHASVDSQLHARSFVDSLVGALPLSRPLVIFHFTVALVVAATALRAARAYVRPGRIGWAVACVLAPAAIVGSLFVPTSYRGKQASPPDALYIHGMVALGKELAELTNESPDLRVQRRRPERLPELASRPAAKRNVLFVLQESQRGDVICAAYDPRCDRSSPFTNALLPKRFPLLQLRSNASTTAISISTMWSGLSPTESRERLHSAPLLWEYAHAAGWDTAYWTSQNLIFGNARQYIQDLPLTRGAVGTHLDREADLDTGAYDELLTRRVKEEWGELEEPFFAVVHYSNPHYPYVHDEELAPFFPHAMDKSPEKNEHFFNYYRNVVYRSDLAVAELVRHVRSTEAGRRTVIVYTADHGESFREHWQMGHTSALYDEEILVQGFVDAPAGTLSEAEEQSLRGAEHELVWHLDLGPTILDLMGLWDDEATAPFRARMPGHPITRPERTLGPVPITNCSWVWECGFRNWGLMLGSLKVEAREWDDSYHCFDVLDDPGESTDLGERLCAPLADLARRTYHAMPNVTPPGRPHVDWGK